MSITSFFAWWYGPGWRRQLDALRERMASTIDYFSIDLLLRTLFAPFRQLSAGKVNGPLGVKMRAFFDRLISRVIGAFVRLAVILVGIVAIFLHGVLGALIVLFWAFIPFLPIVGFILFLSGWIPWSK